MLRIVAAALETSDGIVHFLPRPNRHHHLIHALSMCYGEMYLIDGVQGFVTSDGTFINRIMAGTIAIESGQITALQHPPKLYSEDLW